MKKDRERITCLREQPPARDKAGRAIEIGAMVVIANDFTSFSTNPPKYKTSRAIREPRRRGSGVKYYDSEKFSTVAYIEKNGHRNSKVHFITDSGFETWQKPNNLLVYNGEGGNLNNEGADVFYETYSE